ncbi:MAG TPA: hypothetical protein VK918_01775 [Pyrinomonadaceae bacterium]|nr:hypothetical protein [Pyrinomonadaceae bacterium]
MGESGETLNEEEMRRLAIKLAFDGDEQRFQEFCDVIKASVPPGTTAVLRGSSITGERYTDGAPFDADGPGTSDLDLTLVGDEILEYFAITGSYVPGVHTMPMGEDHPDIAPGLEPLRDELVAMVGRPVNIQASRNFFMYIRGELMGQPYLTLFGSVG